MWLGRRHFLEEPVAVGNLICTRIYLKALLVRRDIRNLLTKQLCMQIILSTKSTTNLLTVINSFWILFFMPQPHVIIRFRWRLKFDVRMSNALCAAMSTWFQQWRRPPPLWSHYFDATGNPVYIHVCGFRISNAHVVFRIFGHGSKQARSDYALCDHNA